MSKVGLYLSQFVHIVSTAKKEPFQCRHVNTCMMNTVSKIQPVKGLKNHVYRGNIGLSIRGLRLHKPVSDWLEMLAHRITGQNM